MSDRVFPKLWEEDANLDEWIWKKIISTEFVYGVFVFEVQVRQDFLFNRNLEFGYYLAHRPRPSSEPEVVGYRSSTRCPGRELLLQGLSLEHHISPDEVTWVEVRVTWEEYQAIITQHTHTLESAPA